MVTKLKKIEALEPIKEEIGFWIFLKTLFLFLITGVLWIVLFVSALIILIYYILSISSGIFSQETIKMSIYLVIGAYFFLILDKKKVDDAFGIRRDLSYITPEQRRDTQNICLKKRNQTGEVEMEKDWEVAILGLKIAIISIAITIALAIIPLSFEFMPENLKQIMQYIVIIIYCILAGILIFMATKIKIKK